MNQNLSPAKGCGKGGGVGGKSKDFFDGITWFLGNGGGGSVVALGV